MQFQAVMDSLSGDAKPLKELMVNDVVFTKMLFVPAHLAEGKATNFSSSDSTLRGYNEVARWFSTYVIAQEEDVTGSQWENPREIPVS
jgi:hypothetical protein